MSTSTTITGQEVNPISDSGRLIVKDVERLLAEGKELPTGWSLTPTGHPLQPGWVVGSFGLTVPGDELCRKGWKEDVEKYKTEIKSSKSQLTLVKKVQQSLIDNGGDKQKVADAAAAVTRQEAEIKEIETKLEKTEELLKALPPEVIPDDQHPWFGRIYANCTGYLIRSTDGNFKQINETQAGRFLREMGISDRRDTQTSSPIDRVFNALHDRHKVDWFGQLAGYSPGIEKYNGDTILIEKGPQLIKPVKGEFPIIREFLDGLSKKQAIYKDCWLHLAVGPLYRERANGELPSDMPAQVLVLAGPVNSGKSVFQKLIVTPLLGGRKTSPYAFLTGRTDFNEELFRNEHLICDDEQPGKNYETRTQFAAGLKKFVASDSHWCHGKGKKALTLPPFWRITVSVNDTPDCLQSIPVNDETMKDKMIVLRTYPEATVKLVERLGGQRAFGAKIREELPAYLYWLLNEFQIPAELKDTRFGMKAFLNQEIAEMVEETAPSMHLLAVMERQFLGAKDRQFTLMNLFSELQNPNTPTGVLPKSPNTLGNYLSELAKISPSNVKKTRTKKGYVYTLNFPGDNLPEQKANEAMEKEKKINEVKQDYDELLKMLTPEDREAILKRRDSCNSNP